jgi:hypothetical protein
MDMSLKPLLLLAALGLPAAEPYAGFWKHWGDGQAELAGYELTMPRYGQPRTGTAVTIFVTEPFSKTLRVKADPGKHPASDETPVMKLNLVLDFPTGVYDYNEMVSVFVDVPTGVPWKISFSRQEWCGHIYQQALFDAAKVRVQSHSYFDGEADQQVELPLAKDAIAEDALLLVARGFAKPSLAPGEKTMVQIMTALGSRKGSEGPAQFVGVTLSRSARPVKVIVPAGTFEADLWTADLGTAGKREVWVERGNEGRILKWQASSGEKAELIRSARMKYWELNGPGGQAELSKLGLKPRPARTM